MLPDQVNNKLIKIFNIRRDTTLIHPDMYDDVPEAEWFKIIIITKYSN